jgi:hypothetical protein
MSEAARKASHPEPRSKVKYRIRSMRLSTSGDKGNYGAVLTQTGPQEFIAWRRAVPAIGHVAQSTCRSMTQGRHRRTVTASACLRAQRAKPRYRASPRINRRKYSFRNNRSNCGGTQQRQRQPRLPLPLPHRSPDSRSHDSRHDSRNHGSLRRALQQRRRPAVLEPRPHRRGNRRHPDRHLRRAEPRHHRGSSRR